MLNKYVFSLRLKLARVVADVTDSGRLFHTVGPATEKAVQYMSKLLKYYQTHIQMDLCYKICIKLMRFLSDSTHSY